MIDFEKLSEIIAKLKKEERILALTEIGAYLHDIGKINIKFILTTENHENLAKEDKREIVEKGNLVHVKKLLELKITERLTLFDIITKHHNGSHLNQLRSSDEYGHLILDIIIKSDFLDSFEDSLKARKMKLKEIFQKFHSTQIPYLVSPLASKVNMLKDLREESIQELKKRMYESLEHELAKITNKIDMFSVRRIETLLREYFRQIPAKTMIPVNDHTLYHHSLMVAKIAKAFICDRIIRNEKNNHEDLHEKWKLLGISFNIMRFFGRVLRIPDMEGLLVTIKDLLEKIKDLFERELLFGACIYEDEDTLIFLIPRSIPIEEGPLDFAFFIEGLISNLRKTLNYEKFHILIEIQKRINNGELTDITPITIVREGNSISHAVSELLRELKTISHRMFESSILSQHIDFSDDSPMPTCVECGIRPVSKDSERLLDRLCEFCIERRRKGIESIRSREENIYSIEELTVPGVRRVAYITILYPDFLEWISGDKLRGYPIFLPIIDDFAARQQVQFWARHYTDFGVSKPYYQDFIRRSLNVVKKILDGIPKDLHSRVSIGKILSTNKNLVKQVLKKHYNIEPQKIKDEDLRGICLVGGGSSPEEFQKLYSIAKADEGIWRSKSPGRILRIIDEFKDINTEIIERVKNLLLSLSNDLPLPKRQIITLKDVPPEQRRIPHYVTIITEEGEFPAFFDGDRIIVLGAGKRIVKGPKVKIRIRSKEYEYGVESVESEKYIPFYKVFNLPYAVCFAVPIVYLEHVLEFLESFLERRLNRAIDKLPILVYVITSHVRFPLYMILEAIQSKILSTVFRATNKQITKFILEDVNLSVEFGKDLLINESSVNISVDNGILNIKFENPLIDSYFRSCDAVICGIKGDRVDYRIVLRINKPSTPFISITNVDKISDIFSVDEPLTLPLHIFTEITSTLLKSLLNNRVSVRALNSIINVLTSHPIGDSNLDNIILVLRSFSIPDDVFLRYKKYLIKDPTLTKSIIFTCINLSRILYMYTQRWCEEVA